MANNIDERIVQMRFNNAQFERGAAQSIKTLDQLNKALKLDSAAKSLAKIEDAVTKVNFSSLANNVENIGKRFTNLGIVGVTAMQRVSNAAIDAGEKMVKSLMGFENIKAGQSKYETETKAVQTITNATGKSVAEVEKVLETLMKYTDETSYDFAQMVASIGKFTAAGVDLNVAERAMEGIANEAAKSGAGIQEANRAMYNFAQSLSAGYVKLIDWKSIENANMATKEFKEQLIATAIELGTIQKKTENVGYTMKQTKKATKNAAAEFKKTEINYKTFNETLQSGWLTSDVLIKTLEKYADTSTEFGLAAFHAAQEALTFTDAIQAVKDAVSSSWLTSFKLIFGDLDEARSLWTRVANALYDFVAIFNESRNELLKGWHELGGYNDLVEAASNIWHSFMGVLQSVKEAWENVFPPITAERLAAVTKQVDKLSRKIRWIFGDQEEPEEEDSAAEKITQKSDTKVMAKAYAEQEAEARQLADKIDNKTSKKKVAALQRELIKKGYLHDKYGADGIYGPNTRAAVKALQRDLGVKVTGTWDKVTKQAATSKKIFDSGSKQLTLSASEVANAVSKTAANSFTAEERAAQKSAHTVKRYVNDIIKHTDKLNKPINKTTKNIEDIKTLQDQLIRTGFLKTKTIADGIYDDDTEKAVRKLQKALGVDITGEWDKATYSAEKHKGILDEIRQRVETVTVGVDETAQATKKVGDEADKSRKKIEKLNQAANQYNPIKKDTLTKQVEDYKKQHENIVDHDLNALERSTAKINGTVVKDFSYGINTVKSKKEFEKLKKEFSYETKDLQIQLRKAGYLPKGFVADGIYNKQTIDAVKKLQRDLGISVNGVWTNSTKEAVRAHGIFTREVERSKTIFSPDVIRDRLRLFTEGIASAVSVVKKVGEGFVSFFKGIVKMFKPVLDPIQRILSLVSIMFKNLDKNVTKSKINKVVKNALGFLKPIADVIETIANGIHEFVDGYLIAISEVGKNGKRIVKKSKITFDSFFEYLIAKLKENPVVKALGDIWGRIKKSPIVKTLTGWIDTIKAKFDKFKVDWGWIGKIKDPIEKVRALIFMLGQTVSKIPGFDLFVNFFKIAGSVIGLFFGKVKQFLADHSVKNLPTFIKAIVDSFKSSIFGKIFGGIVNLAGKFVGIVQSILPIIDDAFPGLLDKLKQKWESVKSVFMDSGKNFLDKITESFLILRNTALEAIDAIFSKWKNFKKDHPILESISNTIESIVNNIDRLFGNLGSDMHSLFGANAEESYNYLGIDMSEFEATTESYKQSSSNINDATKNLSEAEKNISKALPDKSIISSSINTTDTIIDKIKSLDIGKIIGIVFTASRIVGFLKLATGISGIGKGAKALGKGFGGLGETLGNTLTKFFLGAEGKDSLGGILKENIDKYTKSMHARPKDSIGNMMLKIAGSVAILAGSLYLLSAVKPKKAKEGLMLFAEMISFIAIISGALSLRGKAIEELGHGMLEMSGSLAIIVLSIAAMNRIVKRNNISIIDKSISIISGFVLKLAILEYLLTRTGKNSKSGIINIKISGLVSMCSGIALLVMAIGRMVSIINKNGSLATSKSLDMISGLLLKLSVFEVILGLLGSLSKSGIIGVKISGVMGMCIGITILVDAIGKMAKTMEKHTNYEVAFDLITALLTRLGTIEILLAIFSRGKGTKISGILGVAAGLYLIVTAIDKIASGYEKFKEYESAFDLLSGVLWTLSLTGLIFSATLGILSKISVGGALKAVGALTVFFGVTTGLGALIGAVNQWTNGGLLDILVDGANTIGTAIGTFIDSVKDPTGDSDSIAKPTSLVDKLKELGNGFSEVMDSFQPFLNKVESVTREQAVGVKNLVGAIVSITGTNIVDAISSFASGTLTGKTTGSGFVDFANNLVLFVDPLKRFSDSIVGVNAESIEYSVPVMEAVDKLASSISGIGWSELKTTVFDAISGNNSIVNFTQKLVEMAPNLIAYSQSIKGLEIDPISKSADAIEALGRAANSIPGADGFIQKVFGEHDVEKFGSQLSALGEGLFKFSAFTKRIDPNYNPDGSVKALSGLAEVAEKIPAAGGFIQSIFGEKSLDTFGGQLKTLGEGLADFTTATADIPGDYESTGILNALDGLAKIQNKIYGQGKSVSAFFGGQKDLGVFGEQLNTLGTNLNEFEDKTNALGFSNLESIANALSTIGTAFYQIPSRTETSQALFDLQTLFDGLGSLDYSGFETFGSAIVKGINQGIDQNGSSIEGSISGAIDGAVANTKLLYPNTENGAFWGMGSYFIDGFIGGLNANGYKVSDTLLAIVQNAINTAKGPDGLDEHSPSKKAEEMMMLFCEGAVNGIEQNSDEVEKAIGSMTARELKEFVDGNKDMIDEQIEIAKKREQISKGMYLEPAPPTTMDKFASGVESFFDEAGVAARNGVNTVLSSLQNLANTDFAKYLTKNSTALTVIRKFFVENISSEDVASTVGETVANIDDGIKKAFSEEIEKDPDALCDWDKYFENLGPINGVEVLENVLTNAWNLKNNPEYYKAKEAYDESVEEFFDTPIDKFMGDIGTFTDQIGSFFSGAGDAAKNGADPIISSLQDLANTDFTKFITSGSPALETIRKFFVENISSEDIESTVGTAVANIDDGITKAFEDEPILSEANDKLGNVAETTGSFIDSGLEKGINDGKAGVVSSLVSVALAAFNAAKTALDIHSPSKKTEYLGEMTGKGYEKGLLKSEDGVNSASKSVANSLYKNLQGAFSLRSFTRESNRTGSMVGEGLASGVESSTGSVVSSTKKMANALIGSFQQILSIHSPSKKTEELGELTGEGLANGLENSKKAVHAGAAEMLEPVVDDADDIIKDAKEAGESVSKAYSDGVTEGLEDGADDAAKANKYFTQKISSMNYGGVFTYQADKEAENTKKSNYYNNLETHTLKVSPHNARAELMQSADKLGIAYGSKAGTSAKTGVSSALSSASGEELTSGMGEKLSEGLTSSAKKTDTDSAADTVTSKLKKSFEGSGFMNLDEILFGSNQNGKGGKSGGSFFDGIASTLTNGFNSIFGDEEGKGGIFEGLGETFNTGLGSVGDLFNGENGSGLFSGLFETFTSGFEGLFGSKEGSENEGLWSWLKGEFKSGLDSVADGVDGPGFFKKLFGFGDEAGEASEKASETASANITNVTTEAVNKVSEVTAAVQDNVTETAKQAAEAISGTANSATANVETTSDESKKNVVKATGEAVNGVATVAKNAAKTVSDTATLTTEDISNLRAMIESFNEVVNSKIDTAPSIRPVIDYSALEGSASRIRELLGIDDVMTSINTHNSGALATSVAVNAVNNSVISIHDTITKNHEASMRMYSDMADKLETIDRDMSKLKIYLDSDAIVAGTVDKMDRALGKKRGSRQTR